MKHWFASLLMLLPLVSQSETAPSRPAPITVEAQQMELDRLKGISIYQGDVVLTRGTLQLKAETITLYTIEDKLERAVASGTPATLEQQGDEESEPLRARAQQMEYFPQQETVKLTGEAYLWRNDNEVRGENISYDLKQSLVKASADKQKQERVRVILQPQDEAPQTEEKP